MSAPTDPGGLAEGLTERQRSFADHLLASGAVRFGAFRLKLHEQQPDAPLSPIYINLRVLRSFPDAVDATVDVLAELIAARGLTFDLYADIPTAATPLVAVLSHRTRVPMITPRQPKTHGLVEGTIDGAFAPGQTAVLIDDLVSHAESKLETARVLEANGLRVHDVAVLIDREQGGPAQAAAAGYAVHAAVRISQLLAYFLRTGGMDHQRYVEVSTYFAQQAGH
jgi:orotate phosphoribosyltransferase